MPPQVQDDPWADTPTQAPPAQAPPPQPAPAAVQPQADVWADTPAQNPDQNSIAEAHKSWWDWADKSILDDISGGFVSKQLAHENEIGQHIIDHEIAQAHPWRAALAQFYYGSLKDAGNVAMQLTTPGNLALMATGLSKLRALKLLASGANLYFAYRGGEEMFNERRAAETYASNVLHGKLLEGDPDAIQRFLFGAAGLSGGAGGAGKEVQEIANITRQVTLDKLGLSGDLKARVDAKVAQVDAIRSRAANEMQGAQQAAAAEAANIQQQAPVRMGQILRDAAHAVESEHARVSKPFDDMAEEMTKPVSDAPTIRATILDTIKSHGVQDQEIPPKIFNALPKRGIAGESLLDLGGGPTAMEVLRNVPGEDVAPVSFKDLTRVRSDLFDAANSAKDGTVKAAMFDAYDSMTQMQEDYATKNGFGDRYAAAKEDYKIFKRELGSGLMSDFLKAENFKQQAMAPRIAKLMTGTDAEALRGLLKIAGVDTAPLDQLTGGKTVRGATEAAVKGGEKAAKGIQAQGEKEVRALGKNNPIIPGRSDLELAGKSNEEIRGDAIGRLANNMRQQGISNPMGWFMVMFGALRMAAGSGFGFYPFARGTSALTRGRLLRNPSFQDWVIRESGVDPSNLTLIQKLRRGMSRALPLPLARVATEMGDQGRAQDQTGTRP